MDRDGPTTSRQHSQISLQARMRDISTTTFVRPRPRAYVPPLNRCVWSSVGCGSRPCSRFACPIGHIGAFTTSRWSWSLAVPLDRSLEVTCQASGVTGLVAAELGSLTRNPSRDEIVATLNNL